MTETRLNFAPIVDWYRLCGVDAALANEPRNHYVPAQPIKLSFKPRLIENSTLPTSTFASTPTSTQSVTQAEPLTIVQSPKVKPKLVDSDEHPALSCTTLDELRYAMEHSTGCDLIKAATHTVFSGGNPGASIMLIGEAPGADEDRVGQPFVGQSGQLLDTILATIGIDRTSIYISNIIPWRPPGNRPPTTTEMNYCLPFIERHIDLVSPKILILLGGVALKTLLGRSDGILKLRGQVLEYTSKGGKKIAAMPTLHPSYIMRSPSQKALVWKDMLTLKTWLGLC
jgi:DNA polymerase